MEDSTNISADGYEAEGEEFYQASSTVETAVNRHEAERVETAEGKPSTETREVLGTFPLTTGELDKELLEDRDPESEEDYASISSENEEERNKEIEEELIKCDAEVTQSSQNEIVIESQKTEPDSKETCSTSQIEREQGDSQGVAQVETESRSDGNDEKITQKLETDFSKSTENLEIVKVESETTQGDTQVEVQSDAQVTVHGTQSLGSTNPTAKKEVLENMSTHETSSTLNNTELSTKMGSQTNTNEEPATLQPGTRKEGRVQFAEQCKEEVADIVETLDDSRERSRPERHSIEEEVSV